MRAEKQIITKEYLERLNSSPFFIVVEYTGLKVAALTEFRRRLAKAGAEIHIIKNSVFRVAAQEAGVGDLGGSLSGQLAVVTGVQEISVAAKAVKNFAAEFDKPKFRFGFLGNERLGPESLKALADLPPLSDLRAQLMGLINLPATQLAQMISTPARQLALVIKAKADRG